MAGGGVSYLILTALCYIKMVSVLNVGPFGPLRGRAAPQIPSLGWYIIEFKI